MGTSSFFAEIKRRKVLRSCGIYLPIAWMVIESSSVILPLFELPDWLFRAIVIAGIAGLPVVAMLSWAYEFTDEGLVPDAEAAPAGAAQSSRAGVAIIGLLAVALCVSLYINFSGIGAQGAPAVATASQSPVPVLIANFDNRTSEPLFQGTLEDAFHIGIESASFISSYPRTDALQQVQRLSGDEAVLDLPAAKLLALRQGLHMVFHGNIEADGNGYRLQVEAVDPRDSTVLLQASSKADSKLEVLGAVAEVADDIRRGLGDTEVEDSGETFTAASLEAANEYMTAQTLASNWKHADAIRHYEAAVAQDPSFGRAYSGWAYSLQVLGETAAAQARWEDMVKLLNTMTEREQLRSLGLYYASSSGNVDKAVENYLTLVERFPADNAGLNNLAVSYFLKRRFDKALEYSDRLLAIFPDWPLYRGNHALYLMYSGRFEDAAAVGQETLKLDPAYHVAFLPVAINEVIAGNYDAALSAYAGMAAASDDAADIALLGKADLASYRHQSAAAVKLLQGRIAAGETEAAPTYFERRITAWLAPALVAGNGALPATLLDGALTDQTQASLLLPAAWALIEAGRSDDARALGARLGSQLAPEDRAYSHVISGWIALNAQDALSAIDHGREALALADLWLVRDLLGRGYLAAGSFVEAMSEFDACLKRRGEAVALFLDDVPTVQVLRDTPFLLAEAQRGAGMSEDAQAGYRAYLAQFPADARHEWIERARGHLADQ